MEQSPGTPRKLQSGLSLLGILISFLIASAKAIDLVKLGSSPDASAYELRHSSGAPDGASTCTAVRLQLHRPLAELRVLITAGDSQSSLTSFSSAACSAQASIYDSSDVPEMDPCTFAADIASGDLAVEERWLKIDSICPQAFVSIQGTREHLEFARRQLKSVPPGYVLVSNTSGSSQGDARALARNISAALLPSDPGSAPPPQQPPVPVACCCGQNAQNTPGTAQSCCCGPITACCQQTGFCANSNCTAIFVGSTLVAGTIISILTCGVCVYRARAQIRTSQSRDRAGQRLRARRPMRLLPVRKPPANQEGTRRECPVCLEEIMENVEWVVFPCNHATCKDCYHRLVGKLLEDDTVCPMCRAPLAEPVPEPSPVAGQQPDVSLEMQPQQSSSGVPAAQPRLHQRSPSSQQSPPQPQPGIASSQSAPTRTTDALVEASSQLAGSSQSPQDASGTFSQKAGNQSGAETVRMQQASAVPPQQAQSVQCHAQQGAAAASRLPPSQRRHDAHSAGEHWADVPL